MKKYLLFVVLISVSISVYSQKTAITNDGQKIIVYDNGSSKPVKKSINFITKNINGQQRLFLNVKLHDIYKWYKYNDSNFINEGVQSMDIINSNSSSQQKEMFKNELDKYGTYATYSKNGGILVKFYPIIQDGIIRVYKEAEIYITEEMSKELLKTIYLD